MSTEGGVTSLDLDNWQALRRHLVKHADDIARDAALLDALGLQPKTRHLIDFGPAALSRLEARALKDLDVRRQLEMTAKANFDAQNQTHGLILSLLEARNHADLARRLNEESRNRFGLIAATVALEDTAPVPLGWKTLDDGGVDYIVGETGLSLLGPEGVIVLPADVPHAVGQLDGAVEFLNVTAPAAWLADVARELLAPQPPPGKAWVVA